MQSSASLAGPRSARAPELLRGRARVAGCTLAVAFSAAALVVGCGDPVPPASSAPSPATTATVSADPTARGTSPSVSPSSANQGGSSQSPTIRAARLALRLPSARSRAVAVVVGDKLLLCGGLMASGASTASILSIDLPRGTTTPAGHLAAPVHDAGGATLGRVGLVLGGGRVGPGTNVQRIGSTGVRIVGRLPTPRADLGAVTIGDAVVVLGGGIPGRADRQVLETTDGANFRVVVNLPIGVRYGAVVEVGAWAYVIGGTTGSGDVSAIQAVNPRTGVARVIGHLPTPLSHASALLVNGVVLIAGGQVGGRASSALLRLDPATGTVTSVGHLPVAISDAAAVVLNGVGYLLGGEANAHLESTIVSLTVQ